MIKIMKIGFGCDHAAIDLKNELIEYMTEKGYECVDYGTNYDENGEIIKCDYPAKGEEVGRAVVSKEVDYGVLMCGTGFLLQLTKCRELSRQYVVSHIQQNLQSSITMQILLHLVQE